MAILDGKSRCRITCDGLGVICRNNLFIHRVIHFHTISINIQIGKFALPATIWASCDDEAVNFDAIGFQNCSDEERTNTVLVIGIIPNFIDCNLGLLWNPLIGDVKAIIRCLITSNGCFFNRVLNFLTSLELI